MVVIDLKIKYGREYEAYGYDFPSPAIRISQLDEALTIIKAMWSNERSASFEGKYYKIKDAIQNQFRGLIPLLWLEALVKNIYLK